MIYYDFFKETIILRRNELICLNVIIQLIIRMLEINDFSSQIDKDMLSETSKIYIVFGNHVHILRSMLLQKIQFQEPLVCKMDSFIDNCFQSQHKQITLKHDQISNNQFLKDPVDQFLNAEAFINCHNENHQLLLIKEVCKSQTVEEQPESLSQGLDLTPRRKKSIFHNFQKHLITLLKKFIHFDDNTIENDPYQQLAKDIWQAFKKTRCFNKKCLHMLFGVVSTTSNPQDNLNFMKGQNDIMLVLSKNNIQDILEAQAFMREEVVRQTALLSKQLFSQKCQMNRFEEFYQYFKCFMSELSLGPMTKRMTKTRKHIVVQKLMNADSN